MRVVIGYGNELRSDDGVGPRIARTVAGWGLTGVRALAVPQLTPELAAVLAEADRAVFVDAALAGGPSATAMRRLAPARQAEALTHAWGPQGLLALAERLYARHPVAWLVTVPGECFDMGEELSAAAEQGLAEALQQIRQWIEGDDRA
jgi:hydrogenase maturation protease